MTDFDAIHSTAINIFIVAKMSKSTILTILLSMVLLIKNFTLWFDYYSMLNILFSLLAFCYNCFLFYTTCYKSLDKHSNKVTESLFDTEYLHYYNLFNLKFFICFNISKILVSYSSFCSFIIYFYLFIYWSFDMFDYFFVYKGYALLMWSGYFLFKIERIIY